MQTLTVEIIRDNALKMLQYLEEKHFIKILASPDVKSLVLPGEPLTADELKRWVEARENGESISLKTAKKQWEKKEKQLLAPGKQALLLMLRIIKDNYAYIKSFPA